MIVRGHHLSWWAREFGALILVLGAGVCIPLGLAAVLP